MACLCPRNSISNVVASVTIDERNIHFNETIVEAQRDTELQMETQRDTRRDTQRHVTIETSVHIHGNISIS